MLLVAAVVVIVRAAVPAFVPVMLTGLVEPKLKRGGYWRYWAPTELDVRALGQRTTCRKAG